MNVLYQNVFIVTEYFVKIVMYGLKTNECCVLFDDIQKKIMK